MTNWIKNYDQLAINAGRKTVLKLIEAGLSAINTEEVVKKNVKYDGKTLKIKNHKYDLTKYKSVQVVGFGKASPRAAQTLEQILGNKIHGGAVIGLSPIPTMYIRTYQGSHPKPSFENVDVAQHIVDIGNNLTKDDLVIVIVSGGGSALLCWPLDECRQSQKLYEEFLPTGGDIRELNIIRKHISQIKGGGLAKMLYPATVVSLIFSDVPGDDYSIIASGPTYKDTTTSADAWNIIKKYNLGTYSLNETPKEAKYFEKIVNIPLVSNVEALKAMKKEAESMGLKTKILSSELYDEPPKALSLMLAAAKKNQVVLAGGEPRLVVTKKGGTGGRNLYMGMQMLKTIGQDTTFAAVASDGLDNSDSAGVIEDYSTLRRSQNMKIKIDEYVANYDGLGVFTKLGQELLYTGATEANVSDLFILYKHS